MPIRPPRTGFELTAEERADLEWVAGRTGQSLQAFSRAAVLQAVEKAMAKVGPRPPAFGMARALDDGD